MKKFVLILFTCFISCIVVAQQYYNEWIDYSKTYYKFKIAATGLYRINQQNLPAALQTANASQFQLWRNGKEIALYTGSGYIEFWGEKNDGLPDKNLYKDPNNQLSTDLSLETDTAIYFLTVNTGANLRINDAANNVNGNTLTAEQNFMYHYRYDFQNIINRGRAVYYGTNVYSSTYDIGEWWSSAEISPSSPLTVNLGNLHASALAAQPVQLNVSVAGNSVVNGSSRTVQVNLNGSNVISDNTLYQMNAKVLSNNNVNQSLITSANTTVAIANINAQVNDRIVAGFLDLYYPHTFDFGGSSDFAFTYPADISNKYLKITNFNASNATPVLYDLTSLKRYTANTSIAGTLQFVLPANSSSESNLVLVSEDASNIHYITGFQTRNFINFNSATNQSDYLIISNKILGLGANQPVDMYRQYRSSASGGSYNAKIYDIDDLVDEFAYGIKQHPLAVKNFLRYARNTFSIKPLFAFLVGKAVTYDEYRLNQASP